MTPNCSTPQTPPPPTSPNHLAQAVNVAKMFMDEINTEDE